MQPDSFKIVDGDTGNSVGWYHDQSRAFACFAELVTRHPEDRERLVLVVMDKAGHPIESLLAEQVLQTY